MTAPVEIGDLVSGTNRKNNFDLLRLVGAILVAVGHIEFPYFGHNPDWLGSLSNFQSGGGLGVAIFFVVSGYLVAQSRWRSTLQRFSLNRFLRIFPALGACILALTVIFWPVSGLSLPDYLFTKQAFGFLLNAFVLPVNPCVAPPIGAGYAYGCSLIGGTWSLTYELMMYFVVGLLGFATRASQIAFMVVVLIGLTVLLAHDALFPLGEWRVDIAGINLLLFIPFRGLPFVGLFLMGSLLNFVPRQWLTSPLVFITALTLYIGVFKTNPPLFLVVQGIVLPFMVLWVGLRHWKITDIYDRWIGDVSYGIFLYHWPVMTLTWIYLHDKISIYGMSVIFAIVTFLAAYASCHLVEKPALRLKKRPHRMELPNAAKMVGPQ
jgi:peptidoglycan/LPS O-acetylase OafA/YrhL